MITIVPVYPTLLSIYADRGNVRVLEQRCAWRGIDYRVQPLALGADLDPGSADIILLGGGQDRDQVLVAGGADPADAVDPRGDRRRRAACSPSAAATSCSATATAATRATTSPAPAWSTSRRSPATPA